MGCGEVKLELCQYIFDYIKIFFNLGKNIIHEKLGVNLLC